MSTGSSQPRHIVHLAIGGFPVEQLEEIAKLSSLSGSETEIFVLTEASAREALEKIFSADSVAVWGEL